MSKQTNQVVTITGGNLTVDGVVSSLVVADGPISARAIHEDLMTITLTIYAAEFVNPGASDRYPQRP